MHLYRQKREELKKKKKNKFGMKTDFQAAQFLEQDEGEGGYSIDKTLIMEAWSKYRPPEKNLDSDEKQKE